MVKDAKLPKYQEVRSWLLEMLSTRSFQKGERFYTENWVAKEFGIASMTARKAFSLLEAENYLRRVQGAGTFVMKLPAQPTKMQVVTHCTIGVLVNSIGEMDNLRFGSVMTEAYRAIGEKSYMVNLAIDAPEKLIDSKVAGIMVFGVPNAKTIAVLKKTGIPVAGYGCWSIGKFPCVYQTFADIGESIFPALVRSGRRKIAVLHFGSAPEYFARIFREITTYPSRSRHDAEFEFVTGQEHETMRIVSGVLSRKERERPDALYVSSWQSITAVLQAAGKYGLKIPHDLGVVCAGGDLLTLHTDPPITMVQSNSSRGIKTLTSMIFRMITDKNYKGEEISNEVELTGNWTL